MIVKRFVSTFRSAGVSGVLSAAARRIRMPHARSFALCREMITRGTGLDIGGPSSIFAWGGLIPVYPLASRIDNVNFAHKTIWEDPKMEGNSFRFCSWKKPGRRLIAEGTDLREIPSEKYDFVLSSHMLEHTANPLRALAEWRRVLRLGGALVLVVPARDGAFDHRRPITTMSHLVDDFEKGMDENDRTHVGEVLQLHDISRDPGVDDLDTFRARVERNIEFRSLHHHVFDVRLAVNAAFHAGFEVVAAEALRPYHIIVVARNPHAGGTAKTLDVEALREVLRTSPFQSDHQSL